MTTFAVAIALVTLAFALAGCSTGPDPHPPDGWARPNKALVENPDGYGAWVAMRFWQRSGRVEGELISADADSIRIFTPKGLLSWPTQDLGRATVVVGLYGSGSTQLVYVSHDQWERLVPFTRFPRGIPAGLDVSTLLPRP